MWWNSSSQRSRSSSSCSSPVPTSSNLFDNPDPDWMDGQLEQARIHRAAFYRRLQSARNHTDDHVALRKSRDSPSASDVVDVSSLELDFEPHSSWRFYTSFDNGEWKRHAVPVHKVEETVDQGVKKTWKGEVKKSSDPAADSSLRRARQPRTTAAELHQTRCRMRSNDPVESGAANRWTSTNSVDTSFGAAKGGLVDTGRAPSSFRGFTFLDGPQRNVTPQDETCSWRDVTSFGEGLLKSSSTFRTSLPVSSVTVDGIEDTFQEKVMIPTKYKTKNNNTSAGTSDISKPEDKKAMSISGRDAVSGEQHYVRNTNRFDENLTEGVIRGSVSCMTGKGECQIGKSEFQTGKGDFQTCQGEIQAMKSSEDDTIFQECGLQEQSGRADNNNITYNSESHQFLVVSNFVETQTIRNFERFSENFGNKTEREVVTSGQGQGVKYSDEDTLTTGPRGNYLQIIVGNNERNVSGVETSHANHTEVRTAERQENNFRSSGGRNPTMDMEQKAELDTNLTATDQRVSQESDKFFKFVNVLFAEVNEKTDRETSNPKEGFVNGGATESKETTSEVEDSKTKYNTKAAVIENDEENWVIEMAVRIL